MGAPGWPRTWSASCASTSQSSSSTPSSRATSGSARHRASVGRSRDTTRAARARSRTSSSRRRWRPVAEAARRSGLGLGLAAIIPTSSREQEGLRDIPLELIRPNPRQPRRDFDEEALRALADSIRARGVLQPVVVSPLAGGRYELVAGERRLRAAGLAELDRIPAIVRETDDAERLELALIENMARADL